MANQWCTDLFTYSYINHASCFLVFVEFLTFHPSLGHDAFDFLYPIRCLESSRGNYVLDLGNRVRNEINSSSLISCLGLFILWWPLRCLLQLPVRYSHRRYQTRLLINFYEVAEGTYTYSLSNQSVVSIPFTATYCNVEFDNFLGPTTEGFDTNLSSSCLSSILQDCNNYIAANPVTTYYPKISSPCCGNDCDIWAMTARVLYWPTPAVRPGITSYVDENGFTLYEYRALSWIK